jgi:hypothetical protein
MTDPPLNRVGSVAPSIGCMGPPRASKPPQRGSHAHGNKLVFSGANLISRRRTRVGGLVLGGWSASGAAGRHDHRALCGPVGRVAWGIAADAITSQSVRLTGDILHGGPPALALGQPLALGVCGSWTTGLPGNYCGDGSDSANCAPGPVSPSGWRNPPRP